MHASPSQRIRNIKLTVEFDGTKYHGWQIQAKHPTIQQTLEEALCNLTKEPIKLRGASRTDSGVHADAHVSNFLTHSTIPLKGFQVAVNNMLPADISISHIEEVPIDFDAKRHSLMKIYRYQIWNAAYPSALRSRYYWHHPKPLNSKNMRDAAVYLLGENDFSAFRASGCDSKSPFRRMDWIEIKEENSRVIIRLQANAFLRNMVRIIVGTLVEVGLGRWSFDVVPRILESKDRTQAGRTAPPHGLFLEKVIYDQIAHLNGSDNEK